MTHSVDGVPLLIFFEGTEPTDQIVETQAEFQPSSAPIAKADVQQRRREAARDPRSRSASDTKLCAAHKLELYYRRQADLCERIAYNTAQQAIADDLMVIIAEFRTASAAFLEFRKSVGRGAQGSPCDNGQCYCARLTKRRKPE